MFPPEPIPIRLLSSVPDEVATSDPASLVSETRRLIRQPELFKRMAVAPATGARLKAAGKIGPQPIRLSAGCLRYDLEECLAWIRCRRPDGTLPDAKTWPALWQAMQKNANGRRS